MNRVIDELGIQPFHDAGIKGAGVVVAVIDAGFDLEHPEIKDSIIDTYRASFLNDVAYNSDMSDVTGHGTPVASIVAGSTIGLAPDAKLLLIKVADDNGGQGAGSIALGIKYAIDWRGQNGERVSIINMSLGSSIKWVSIRDQVRRAVQNDILVVCAAGNEGDGLAGTNEWSYPAGFPESVSVGAYASPNFRVSAFSNSNAENDLIAPGANVDAAKASGGYRKFSGTSSAAPCVSGAAALLYQKFVRDRGRYPTEQELYNELIKHTTKDGQSETDKRMIGNGRLFLSYEEAARPAAEDIDINVAIDGICRAGIFDSPQYWKEIMQYCSELKQDHPEYYRFKYVQLAFQKFYQHIM